MSIQYTYIYSWNVCFGYLRYNGWYRVYFCCRVQRVKCHCGQNLWPQQQNTDNMRDSIINFAHAINCTGSLILISKQTMSGLLIGNYEKFSRSWDNNHKAHMHRQTDTHSCMHARTHAHMPSSSISTQDNWLFVYLEKNCNNLPIMKNTVHHRITGHNILLFLTISQTQYR